MIRSHLGLLLAAASLAAPGVPEAGPPSKRDRPIPRPPDRLPAAAPGRSAPPAPSPAPVPLWRPARRGLRPTDAGSIPLPLHPHAGKRVITLPCLTLIEPYASLCAAGVKTIETRRGGVLSRIRGPLLIAASKKPGKALDDWAPPKPRPPGGWPEDLGGHAIGVVHVSAVGKPWGPGQWVWMDSRTGRRVRELGESPTVSEREAWRDDLRRRACVGELGGRWLACLDRAAWLTRPVPVRGRQGWYPVELEAALLPEWARPAFSGSENGN